MEERKVSHENKGMKNNKKSRKNNEGRKKFWNINLKVKKLVKKEENE